MNVMPNDLVILQRELTDMLHRSYLRRLMDFGTVTVDVYQSPEKKTATVRIVFDVLPGEGF